MSIFSFGLVESVDSSEKKSTQTPMSVKSFQTHVLVKSFQGSADAASTPGPWPPK
jgi:hypothetical protein